MFSDKRELVLPEKFFFWRTKLGFFSGFRVLSEHSIKLTPALVYHAVSLLCYKYSVFVTDVFPIENTEFGYGLGLVDEVKFSDVVEFINDETLTPNKILDNYINTKFKYSNNKPLWKLTIINEKYALFFCDHVLFDGTSGKNFHTEFAKIIGQGIPPIAAQFFKGLDSVVFQKFEIDPKEYLVLPSPTDLIKYEGTRLSLIYRLILALAPKSISNWIKYLFDGHKYAKILSYDTLSYRECALIPEKASSSRIVHLNKDKLDSLLKVCKLNDVKLTALLITISHISLGKFIGEQGRDSNIVIPVDIRFLIDEKKAYNLNPNFTSTFGNYVGSVNVNLPSSKKICINDKINWETVKFVNETIHEGLPNAATAWELLKFTDIKQYVFERYSDYNQCTFEISNIGKISDNIPSIKHAWFDQKSQIFAMNSISTKEGCNLVLRCCNEEWIDGFASKIENIIDELIN